MASPAPRPARRSPHSALRRALAAACAAAALACGGGGGGGSDDRPPFTVSGSMVTTAGSERDSDTNDTFAPFAPNDSPAQAQEIRNPVTLGGHVNEPGAKPPGAPSGRTTAAGDEEDWFRISLATGQLVRLLIAEDGAANNLDLELWASDGTTLVDDSAGTTRVEEISVPATDAYYVVVVAAAGFSNYTLAIGQMSASAGAAQAEFVPGQVLVRYASGRALARAGAASLAEGVGMRHLSGAPDGPMLFAAESPEERGAALRALGVESGPTTHSLRAPAADPLEDTRLLVEALRARPEIRSADFNYVRQPSEEPADEYFPLQWHYDQINLPAAWDAVDPDSGVIVAVLDTGIKANHPEFTNQLVAGYDFISDATRGHDGNGCDSNPNDTGDLAAGGSSYHGTHVAGTVAARTSLAPPGDTDGVAGVAWNARVMPLRVLGVGGGTDADIIAAIRFAAGLDNSCLAPPPAQNARIINMSLGGPGFNQTLADLIQELRSPPYNIAFVASAGNESSTAPSYPAAFPGVISVSAVGPTRTRAPYSNFGPTIDVAAPGGDFARDVDGDGFPDGVLSTFFDEGTGEFGYAFFQGTSMSAPHVSGVLALMLGINPALTPVDIDNALALGAITENIGSANEYGHGLIDAVKAVNHAAEIEGGAVPTALLRVDPSGLNFGLLAGQLVLTASNGGNDDEELTVLDFSFASDGGGAWLTIVDEADPVTGLGNYRAQVDRSGLADGLYTGTLNFDSDVNDVEVPVIMQVGNPAIAEDDAGHQYLLLVDAATLETLYEAEADPVNGSYPFFFDEMIDPGEYLLIAGSDFDNDLVICDAGEACGVYVTIDSPTPIVVDRDRGGISFNTGYGPSLGSSVASVTPGSGGYSRVVGGRPPAAE